MLKIVYFALFLTVCYSARRRTPPEMIRDADRIEHQKTVEGMKTFWMEQPVDHFDPLNKRTFKQRYFVGTDHWNRANGPVFFYLGAEGNEDPQEYDAYLTQYSTYTMAKKYGGLALVAEHRFYGATILGKDMLQIQNLRYLSSQQALADYALTVKHVMEQFGMTNKNRWICTGASYGGMLAAYFRTKYPHLVFGCVASSAPVNLVVTNTPWFVDVTQALSNTLIGGSSSCASQVQAGYARIDTLLRTKNYAQLVNDFQLCDPPKSKWDVFTFSMNINMELGNGVQLNNDIEGWNVIHDVCNSMAAHSDPYTALVTSLRSSRRRRGVERNCTDMSYEGFLKQDLDTRVNAKEVVGGRQWDYQMCSEYGLFPVCGPNCILSHFNSLDLWLKLCQDAYGIDPGTLYRGVAFNRQYYGALNLAGSRLVLPNGQIDPWHYNGILSSKPQLEQTAFVIPGASHVANTCPPHASELKYVKEARVRIHAIVEDWLRRP